MSTEEQLTALLAEVKKLTKSSMEQEKTLATMSTKLDTIKDDISALIEEKFDTYIKRVDTLEKHVEKLDDKSDASIRVCNLLLTGIPFKENENVATIVRALSHKLGYEEPPETMQYRFKSDNPQRPILIRFSTEFHKIQFLQLYYKIAKNLTCAAFTGFAGNNNRIYLQHDFTPIQYKFHKLAMTLKKTKKIAEVKINMGNIIVVKINARDKFKAFNSEEDLQNEITSCVN